MKYFPVEKKYGNILTHTETKENIKAQSLWFPYSKCICMLRGDLPRKTQHVSV